MNIQTQVRQLISRAYIKEAIEIMLKNPSLFEPNTMILLSGQFNRNNSISNTMTNTTEAVNRENNRITLALLGLVDSGNSTTVIMDNSMNIHIHTTSFSTFSEFQSSIQQKSSLSDVFETVLALSLDKENERKIKRMKLEFEEAQEDGLVDRNYIFLTKEQVLTMFKNFFDAKHEKATEEEDELMQKVQDKITQVKTWDDILATIKFFTGVCVKIGLPFSENIQKINSNDMKILQENDLIGDNEIKAATTTLSHIHGQCWQKLEMKGIRRS